MTTANRPGHQIDSISLTCNITAMGIEDISFDFEDSEDLLSPISIDEDTYSSTDSFQDNSFSTVPVSLCYGCGGVIEDKFVVYVNDHSWHPTCLRCSHCHRILDNHSSCYVKDGKIYCSKEELCVTCSKCSVTIRSDEWVRKAHGNCYHLACFSCDICKRLLPTGEQFAIHNNRLHCKMHYLQVLQGETLNRGNTGKRKAKRSRTAFNEEQVQIFQSYFDVEQNPDPQDLDCIAQQAGVCRRVAQVWFQNARARSKKSMQTSRLSPISVSSSSEQSFDSLEDLISFH